MHPAFLGGADEPKKSTPHLSHSRVSRYLSCPEQYRLYYLENLRPKVPPAVLVFGQIIHQALADFFSAKKDAVKSFRESWGMLKGIPLSFKQRESWEKLSASGEKLLTRFMAHEVRRITDVKSVERPFTLSVTNLDLPFVGVIDLLAKLDGEETVVDWKTSGSGYDGHEAILADQLSAYKLAEPLTGQLALCVLVKNKEPQIEWHCVDRCGKQLTEYLSKVGYVAKEIADGRFYKRSGMWCAWCDFLPICTGNRQKARDTLVSVP